LYRESTAFSTSLTSDRLKLYPVFVQVMARSFLLRARYVEVKTVATTAHNFVPLTVLQVCGVEPMAVKNAAGQNVSAIMGSARTKASSDREGHD
jgi:hypothetical protein